MIPLRMAGIKRLSMAPPTIQLHKTSFPPQGKSTSSVLRTLILNSWPLNLYTLGAGIPDRKSTRLNSSHVRISYAVFCLKKKKKQNKRGPDHRPSRASRGHPGPPSHVPLSVPSSSPYYCGATTLSHIVGHIDVFL